MTRKTQLYSLDHERFRYLVGSGESGLADRLMRRQGESEEKLGEAELDDLEELLREIERKGAVRSTGDRKMDDLLNHALWLVAEEAGLLSEGAGAGAELYEEAREALSRGGWFSRVALSGEELQLLTALYEGRVYGSQPAEGWTSDTVTAILDPGEVRQLLAGLRGIVDARGARLPAAVQDLLDQHLFPGLESAARSQMGLLAVTRPE